MKTNDFFEAMGNIDASLIERADKTAAKPRKTDIKTTSISHKIMYAKKLFEIYKIFI